MAGVKKTINDYTLSRRPVERSADEGVTIAEIEKRVSELFPVASFEAMRAYSLLFAILKQGTSLQKLQWFTLYNMDFISQRVEALRSAGFLYTGTLSTQYVLRQLPGSEDLIERITGQRIVSETITHKAPAGYPWEKNLQPPPIAPPAPPVAKTNGKEKPMNIGINGAADEGDVQAPAQQTCEKSSSCGKPANHMGRCKGDGGSAERTRRMKQAGAKKRKASAPKPAAAAAAAAPEVKAL